MSVFSLETTFSRGLDDDAATSNSRLVGGGSYDGSPDSLCAFRQDRSGRNDPRGHSTHGSHDDSDRSTEDDRLQPELRLPEQRPLLVLPKQSVPWSGTENSDI